MPGTFIVCECVCVLCVLCVYVCYVCIIIIIIIIDFLMKKTGAWRSRVIYQQGDSLIITRTEIQRQAVCSQAN